MTAENLARGERLHQEAIAAHQAASDKAQAITDRLASIRTRQQAITESRLAGTSNDQEAAEYAALTGDAELLGKMQIEAQAAIKTATDQAHGAYVWYTDAKRAHDREQAGIEYEALRAKTAEIEALFVRAIAATHAAGRGVGHHTLGQSWQPSQPLHRAVHYGVCPEV